MESVSFMCRQDYKWVDMDVWEVDCWSIRRLRKGDGWWWHHVMTRKGTLWYVDVCQLPKKAWSTVIESGTRGVQWDVTPRLQHFMTYSDKWREWDEGQCEDVLHLWRKRCREPLDRLEVWPCISESMFHVHFTILKPAPPPKHYVSIRSPPRLCLSMESSVESRYPIMTSQADFLSCSDSVLQYIITSGKSSEWSLLHAMSGEM